MKASEAGEGLESGGGAGAGAGLEEGLWGVRACSGGVIGAKA